jgi:hypothetical protein
MNYWQRHVFLKNDEKEQNFRWIKIFIDKKFFFIGYRIQINSEGINFLFHRDTFDWYSQALVEPIYGKLD